MPSGILVIQNARGEDLGSFAPALKETGVEARYRRPYEGDAVPSTILGHSGLVVLGGPQHVYEAVETSWRAPGLERGALRHSVSAAAAPAPHGSAVAANRWPYLAREMALIREAHATPIPFLGVCLGAQLAAQALGGRAMRGERGPEVGWMPVALTADGGRDALFDGLPRALDVFQSHGDTFDLPRGAVLLASSPDYPQAFRLGDRSYALQFHAEFTREAVAAACAGEPNLAELLRATELRAADSSVLAATLFSRWLSISCFD